MPPSLTLQVSNLAQSTSFFLSTLQPLEYIYHSHTSNDNTSTIGFAASTSSVSSPPDFWLEQKRAPTNSTGNANPSTSTSTTRVAFPARSPERVREFFRAAVKAGGNGIGEPAARAGGMLYTAVVADLDGNMVEAVYTGDTHLISAAGSSVESNLRHGGSAVSGARIKSEVKANSLVSMESRSQRQSTIAQSKSQNGTNVEEVGKLLGEARGMLSIATELMGRINSRSPHTSTDSAVKSSAQATTAVPTPITAISDPASHKPSDTIVGTLLGVAAGAALGYAFSKVAAPTALTTETVSPRRSQSAVYPYHQTMSRGQLNDEKQLVNSGRPESMQSARQCAIEALESQSTSDHTHVSGRKVLMLENAAHNIQTASIISLPASSKSRSRTEQDVAGSSRSTASKTTKRSSKSGPESQLIPSASPSSYRDPTVATQLDGSHVSLHHSSLSSHSSSWKCKANSSNSQKREDLKIGRSNSEASEASVSTAKPNMSSSPDTGGNTASTTSKLRVTVLASESMDQKQPSPAASSISPKPISLDRERSSVDPLAYPLPAFRAGTTIERSARRGESDGGTVLHSTHFKACKTVIGRVQAQTESVLGKLRGLEDIKVTASEVEPSDSVSQISSQG